MGLFVHHGPHPGPLAAGLVQRLAVPADDPFQRAVVAVPTTGVRDWVTRRIASDLGIAANIAMPFPGAFFTSAIGIAADDDPWAVERLTWAVLAVLDAGVVEVPGWESASRPGDPSRRFAVARRIADLFDRYATTRPEMLHQWQRGIRGDGTLRANAPGGARQPEDESLVGGLPPAMEWQFDLWRHVRQRIGTPSAAEVLPERIEQLRSGELVADLPTTVDLFGVSALTRTQLDVLAALGVRHEVHVSLLHPSAVAWARTAPVDVTRPTVRARHDIESSTDSHPLLRSWGRLSTEAAALVRGVPPPTTVAAVETPAAPPTSLLAHLQADLGADRPPTPFARVAADVSVQVHACPGTLRQLEVLRDVLGHLFVADPLLRPDDVLVICPDLERFEPFAAAVLGRGALPVPVTVSDLSLGTENPVAAALATIVHTVAGRCTASDVLAVAALDPVRHRLGISADDLDRFGRWSERLGTSWGLDTDHRRTWLDSDIDSGTWEQALRSLLVGAAVPAPTPRTAFGGIVPFDDVGGDDVAVIGRLAELVSRLRHVRREAAAQRPIGQWCDLLDGIVALLCAPPPAERWQEVVVIEAIDDLRRSSAVGGAASAAPLAFDDLLAAVDGIVAGRRGRLRLRTGRVTMTGSAPVRNVPTKVVCLLGFDESGLRRGTIDGDDLLAVRPCVGERDRHAERRHLLLDALLAAEQTLVITCDGSDVTTNREMRLAVPLSELLDVVGDTLEPVAGENGHRGATVLTRHPLRAYDERNFALAGPGLRSFDDVMCRAAETRRHRQDRSLAVWRERWAVDHDIPERVTLRQLLSACVNPAQTLLREGLDVRLRGEAERLDHLIPLGVDKRDAAFVGQRLLERYGREAAALGSGDGWEAAALTVLADWTAAERLAATAPPGRLIEDDLTRLAADVDAIAAAAECCGLERVDLLGADTSIPIDLPLDVAGRLLEGAPMAPRRLHLNDTVGGIADTVICRLTYRRPRPSAVVAAVLDLAAVVAASGKGGWRVVTACRPASRSGRPECHLIEVVAADPVAAAYTLLEVAAELRVAALRSAVPVFELTTKTLFDAGYIEEEELLGSDFRRGDLDDSANHFVWGDVSLTELIALSPSPGALAQQLWGSIHALAGITKVDDRQRSR